MHPRIEELSRYLDAQRAVLRAAIDRVPAGQRGVAPEPGRWSVDGVVEHLAIVESRIVGLLRTKADEARARGVGRETDDSPVLAEGTLRRMVDRAVKISASEFVQPKGAMDAEAAWAALQSSRERLRDLLRDIDGIACREIFAPHPALGSLDLYAWIGFVGAHEARHADQIREIGALVGVDA
jgi:DinB family protein